jgi:glycosyltransferase involved in cell wall biosynthesis
MKIAFATLYDPRDVRRGSGSYYFMSREIERQGHDVSYVGPVDWTPPLLTRAMKKLADRMGRRFRSFQDLFAVKEIARAVTVSLRSIDYDVLLTNDYGIAAHAESDTTVPTILYTDAIFPRQYRANVHPWLDNLFLPNVLSCQHITRVGLRKAALCCFPSQYAFDLASKYGVSYSKMRIIPFGANIETPLSSIAHKHSWARIKKKGLLDILFVGSDWELKGGAIAVDVVRSLCADGIAARLHIVGVVPPSVSIDEEQVHIYGNLDKTVNAQRKLLHELYQQSDVFLLPTSAEGFGVVFAEAAAYGLPSLGFQTSGVTTAAKNGWSGVLIPLDTSDPVQSFVEVIHSWCLNPHDYDSLVRGARQYFEETVNWQVAISRLFTEIETVTN